MGRKQERPCPDERRHLAAANTGLAAEAVWIAARADIIAGRAEFDDLMGVALAGLVRAARDWEPGRARFSTLAVTYAVNAVRRHRADERRKAPPAAPASLSYFDGDPPLADRGARPAGRGDAWLAQEIMGRLPLGQALALHLHSVEGLSEADSCAVLHLTSERWRFILRRARKNAREVAAWLKEAS